MLKIAHRGNTDGPSSKENSPEYIQEAIDQGHDAEIDIWLIDGKLFSGHTAKIGSKQTIYCYLMWKFIYIGSY